jgi:hypothetical protein
MSLQVVPEHRHVWYPSSPLAERCHEVVGEFACACGARRTRMLERENGRERATWFDVDGCERCRQLVEGDLSRWRTEDLMPDGQVVVREGAWSTLGRPLSAPLGADDDPSA